MWVAEIYFFRKVRHGLPTPPPTAPPIPRGVRKVGLARITGIGHTPDVDRVSSGNLERTRTDHTTEPGERARGGSCCPGWQACVTTKMGARATRVRHREIA
jgi:hypothetical protein